MLHIKPFKHDCDKCVWVGWITAQGRLGNMYFCPKNNSEHGTVLIRFSDDPPDYWSSSIGACKKGSLSVTPEGASKEVLVEAVNQLDMRLEIALTKENSELSELKRELEEVKEDRDRWEMRSREANGDYSSW